MPRGKKAELITAAPAVAVEVEVTDDAAVRHHRPSAVEPAARALAENGRDETTPHQEGAVRKAPILNQNTAPQTAGNRGLHAGTTILTFLQSYLKVAAGDQGVIH